MGSLSIHSFLTHSGQLHVLHPRKIRCFSAFFFTFNISFFSIVFPRRTSFFCFSDSFLAASLVSRLYLADLARALMRAITDRRSSLMSCSMIAFNLSTPQ